MIEDIHFTMRTDESLYDIKQSYQKFGYFSPIREEDKYFLAYDDDEIIAIVRIAKEYGTSVLRGMYIDQKYHRQGIGRRMLTNLKPLLDREHPEIYCVPFSHLVPFYGVIGFEKSSLNEAPEFLKGRVEDYRKKGMDSILMKRSSF